MSIKSLENGMKQTDEEMKVEEAVKKALAAVLAVLKDAKLSPEQMEQFSEKFGERMDAE